MEPVMIEGESFDEVFDSAKPKVNKKNDMRSGVDFNTKG